MTRCLCCFDVSMDDEEYTCDCYEQGKKDNLKIVEEVLNYWADRGYISNLTEILKDVMK